MMVDRRRRRSIDWGVPSLLVLSILSQIFFYGQLTQQVKDLAQSLAEVRAAVFDGRGGK